MRLIIEQSEIYQISSKPTQDVCVCGGDTETKTFNIIMTHLGAINISTSVSMRNISHRTMHNLTLTEPFQFNQI